MQYGAIKRKVLEYLHHYSIAGSVVSPAYNNQSDYVSRIPGLINDAIAEIRDLYPKRRMYQLNGGRIQGDWALYSFPPDCRQLCTGGVYVGDSVERTHDFRLFGESGILVPNDGLRYWIEYYQIPEQMGLDPDDNYDFNEDLSAIDAACTYAASWLALDDDQFDHTALNNLFEGKLERMRPRLTAEIHEIPGVFETIGLEVY